MEEHGKDVFLLAACIWLDDAGCKIVIVLVSEFWINLMDSMATAT